MCLFDVFVQPCACTLILPTLLLSLLFSGQKVNKEIVQKELLSC